ncbi:expressed unknown protein [Ectocarpus siliculosus]|uniref:Uncharacterized protein n=1 Tax=Ectocarpus siliculosus TaxID=2880 RepID=D8LNC4_ECTSI|nr:expressed unknown protein [Ectocarpus siliculosus]|eukprot:CBN77281.1 expressed unknown protein [Ectocarpus siliculosus]
MCLLVYIHTYIPAHLEPLPCFFLFVTAPGIAGAWGQEAAQPSWGGKNNSYQQQAFNTFRRAPSPFGSHGPDGRYRQPRAPTTTTAAPAAAAAAVDREENGADVPLPGRRGAGDGGSNDVGLASRSDGSAEASASCSPGDRAGGDEGGGVSNVGGGDSSGSTRSAEASAAAEAAAAAVPVPVPAKGAPAPAADAAAVKPSHENDERGLRGKDESATEACSERSASSTSYSIAWTAAASRVEGGDDRGAGPREAAAVEMSQQRGCVEERGWGSGRDDAGGDELGEEGGDPDQGWAMSAEWEEYLRNSPGVSRYLEGVPAKAYTWKDGRGGGGKGNGSKRGRKKRGTGSSTSDNGSSSGIVAADLDPTMTTDNRGHTNTKQQQQQQLKGGKAPPRGGKSSGKKRSPKERGKSNNNDDDEAASRALDLELAKIEAHALLYAQQQQHRPLEDAMRAPPTI